MRQYTKDNILYRTFDSVDEMLEDARSDSNTGRYVDYDPSFVGRRLNNWSGVEKAMAEEWTEGDAMIESMLDELGHVDLPKPVCRKRKRRWSEDNGDEIEYDRLRNGQPFWRESRRQMARGSKFVTLVVDVSTQWTVDADKILWRGAAAVILTHLLEQAGYRVELWANERGNGCYTQGDASNCSVSYRLKSAGELLDMSTMTKAVSGWFYRTVVFRAIAQSGRGTTYTLGRPRVASKEDVDEITYDEKRRQIHGVWSRDKAIELIQTTIMEIERQEAGELVA